MWHQTRTIRHSEKVLFWRYTVKYSTVLYSIAKMTIQITKRCGFFNLETQEFQSMIDEWCLRRTKAVISDQLPHKGKDLVRLYIYTSLINFNNCQGLTFCSDEATTEATTIVRNILYMVHQEDQSTNFITKYFKEHIHGYKGYSE